MSCDSAEREIEKLRKTNKGLTTQNGNLRREITELRERIMQATDLLDPEGCDNW